MAKFSFPDTLAKIMSTPPGKEASMYGPLRDLFIHALGYPAGDVDIDTTGEGGRPDVTVNAPVGLVDRSGKAVKAAWIVVEAKDEPSAFSNPDSRERIFADKAKYIGAHTGWFVMADPTVLVARLVGGSGAEQDIVLHWSAAGGDVQSFAERFPGLKVSVAGVSKQLARFREGDTALIATLKLAQPDPAKASPRDMARHRVLRKRFFLNLRESTEHLQSACRSALAAVVPKAREFQALRDGFARVYGYESFDPVQLQLHGKPQGPEMVRAHDKASRELRRQFAKHPHIARLALDGLPMFQSRTGADDGKVEELFAIETANLILARVLLLRFFEDHGFFGQRRYICNGGIEAFQKMRHYFAIGYTHLLEQAYQNASRLYAAAFDETELDWVFGAEDPGLSAAIEWTLFQFSRYDFTTVQGDILTGIYDRFMDRAKRKEMGEFFTPPSVARYIVRRCGVKPGDKLFDPSCGSGTFLIEAYRELVGDDADRGFVEYGDAVAVLGNLCGNDLNTFSAVLTQIQLLWQILRFKDAIEAEGFPDLPVTGKVNSLVIPGHFASLERFGELDVPEYAAVVGNPPYVRKERSAQDLDARTVGEFERLGVSAKLNSYALFIVRALGGWCRPAIDGVQAAGRLGFIVQLSLFDANETDSLRQLFRIGGRWTILEIVDLELIYRSVFDADVLPVVILCENRPATAEDKVSLRLADKSCVREGKDGGLPEFDLEGLPESRIPYADVFTPDGRILTRLTNDRLAVVRKLWANPRLREAAKPYWVFKVKSKIVQWQDTPPAGGGKGWSERRMLAGGVAFRGQKATLPTGGHTVYKGENIIAAELQGDPIERNSDLTKVSDASLWQYGSILPSRAYAVAQVAHCPNAVAFDPRTAAFTNTATFFVPCAEAASVPFDLLFLSNVYVFFYGVATRMGTLRQCRSHIYPTNLGLLPWNNALVEVAGEIEALRGRIVPACRKAVGAGAALLAELDGLPLQTLKERVKADAAAAVAFGENFDAPGHEAEIIAPGVERTGDSRFAVRLSDDLLDWVELNREVLASALARALAVRPGALLGKSALLGLRIPVDAGECETWDAVVAKYAPDELEREKQSALLALDMIIGKALGLDSEEITFIAEDCASDPFLKRIRPRYPGTVTRKQGFRAGLDSKERYD